MNCQSMIFRFELVCRLFFAKDFIVHEHLSSAVAMPFYAEEPKALDVQSTSSGRSNNGSSLPIRVLSGLVLVRQVTEVHDDDPRHSSGCQKREVESDFVSSSYPSSKKLKTDNTVDEPTSCRVFKCTAFEEPTIPSKILQQARKAKISDFKFDTDRYAICYTDGSCVTNLKTSGVGVWFGKDHVANISEPLPVPGTSNRAELTAILYAIHAAKEAGLKKLRIRTDSSYAKNCITVWMANWEDNDWKTTAGTAVLNQNEIRAIRRALSFVEVDFKWVSRAENGDADELAKAGADESLRIYGSVTADASAIMMTSSNADDEDSIRVNDYSTVQCNPVLLLHAHGPSSTTHFSLDGYRASKTSRFRSFGAGSSPSPSPMMGEFNKTGGM
ncbi:unnamed protein product [Notodromas monacha]|uniref:ribonuclease H n=1 Tax=Notodromas monacha TaxID=399045 RepID=A0A7R9GFI6_9CRUS|nr:unnamed protein product [Notodromas monacha]CAG0919191.1 unnamed protein product [Notodromas monacha]